MYNEFINIKTDDDHYSKMEDFLQDYNYMRYAKPSPALRQYCKDYVASAISYVTIEIGTPIFTVYQRDISADFVTKIGALGRHITNNLK